MNESDKIIYVEQLLDKGATLMDIQGMFENQGLGELPLFGGKRREEVLWADLNKEPYSPYYFDEDNEGINFYSPKNMSKYLSACGSKRLPLNGIITSDGKIYRTDYLHIETAFWLKYNGVNLEKSLRFTYFVETNRLEIRDCYDYEPIRCNNPDELFSIWSVRHDENRHARNLMLTEEQVQSIYYLKTAISNRYGNLDFERIFEENEGFRMNPASFDAYTAKQRMLGEVNNETVNRALKSLSQKNYNYILGE